MTENNVVEFRPQNGSESRKPRSHAERVKALIDYATQQQAHGTIDVVCPDQTKRLRQVFGEDEPEFTVTVRPMKLDEMIALGAVPDALLEQIDEFNTSAAVFQFENERREDEDDASFNRRGIAAAIRQSGMLAFSRRSAETRDATVVICSENPRILFSELERNPDAENEMVLTDFTVDDRAEIYRSIQKFTGELTEEELKSLVESEDQGQSDSSPVAEEPIAETDSDRSGETD